MTAQNIASFLKQLRKTSALSANEVVEKLREYNITISAKTLYGYESGLSMLNADAFVALCKIYKCDNPMDIFGGTSVSSSELSMIEKYRTLDDYGRETVRMILEREIERTKTMQEQADTISDLSAQLIATPTRKRIFAYYGKIAAAGTSVGFEDMIEGTKEYDETDLNRRADYVIGVSGDSMEPTYYDGNIVYVKKTYDLKVGDIGIFQKDNGIYIKEVGKDALISHNAKYKPIKGDDGVICLGKVIGKAE